jgi:hypothetical protein
MNIQQAITNILNTFAGTITAIIVIAGVITKIKPIGAALKRFAFAELYSANENQDKRLNNLEMQQLKQIICDCRLPDRERLNAGDEYIRRGGNGEIQMIYKSVKDVAKKKHIKEREQMEQKEIENRREL